MELENLRLVLEAQEKRLEDQEKRLEDQEKRLECLESFLKCADIKRKHQYANKMFAKPLLTLLKRYIEEKVPFEVEASEGPRLFRYFYTCESCGVKVEGLPGT